MRGFGQNEVQMVPLHMAMVTASVANGGVMMKPYVVDHTVAHDGATPEHDRARGVEAPMTPETAFILNALMQEVVKPARRAAACSSTTACRPPPRPAPRSSTTTASPNVRTPGSPRSPRPAHPKYAIAVMLKGTNDDISASTGGRLAGPVAKQVLDFAFANGI